MEGPRGLTVAALCDHVDATRGSFYYHFESLAEFVEAFLAFWQARAFSAISTVMAEDDPLRRLGIAVAVASMSPTSQVDAALTSWARSDASVRCVVDHVFEQAAAALAEIVAPFVAPERIPSVVRMLMAVGVGLRATPETPSRLEFLQCLTDAVEATCHVRGSLTNTGGSTTVRFTR